MTYAAKDYAKLLGMAGFSETLLKNHFTLYQGYVTNTNKLLDTLAAMLKEGKVAAPPSPEYSELKRRLGLGVQRHAAARAVLREPRRHEAARRRSRPSRRSSPPPSAAPPTGRRTSAPAARCAASAGSCSTRTATAW